MLCAMGSWSLAACSLWQPLVRCCPARRKKSEKSSNRSKMRAWRKSARPFCDYGAASQDGIGDGKRMKPCRSGYRNGDGSRSGAGAAGRTVIRFNLIRIGHAGSQIAVCKAVLCAVKLFLFAAAIAASTVKPESLCLGSFLISSSASLPKIRSLSEIKRIQRQKKK